MSRVDVIKLHGFSNSDLVRVIMAYTFIALHYVGNDFRWFAHLSLTVSKRGRRFSSEKLCPRKSLAAWD